MLNSVVVHFPLFPHSLSCVTRLTSESSRILMQFRQVERVQPRDINLI